jgi:hypothetical protein
MQKSPPDSSALKAAAAFAFYPNRYLHESWRSMFLPDAVWEVLAQAGRTEGRLARYVCGSVGLPPLLSLGSLQLPKARLCLLPPETILRVAVWVALALNAKGLKRLVDAPSVARIRRELPAASYDFVVRRAPLLTRSADLLSVDLSDEAPLADQLERSGVNYIAMAVDDLDPGVKARLKLKLPKRHADLFESSRGQVGADAAWQLVLKIVREVEPECEALLV